MTDLTPEELDKARAEEACGLWNGEGHATWERLLIAARLAREGWTPTPPVDPVLLKAREIAAKWNEERGWWAWAACMRAGKHDLSSETSIALAAYRAAEAETKGRLEGLYRKVVEAGKLMSTAQRAAWNGETCSSMYTASRAFDAALAKLEAGRAAIAGEKE